MTIEIITSIRQAELQADQVRRQSHEEARRIISEANDQAFKHLEQSVEESEQEAREIIREAEKDAEAEIGKLKEMVDEECSEICLHARKNLDKAADMILGRIVKLNGDS